MSDIRWKTSLHNLGKSLDRLGEILKTPLDEKDYVLDATIQSFEFCHETALEVYKAIQKYYPEMRKTYDLLSKNFIQR